MTSRVRLATDHDVAALFAIKRRLAYSDSNRGGFLLGCDEAGYRHRVSAGGVWVLEQQSVVGFAVTLSPEVFRASEHWAAKDRVKWNLGSDVGNAMANATTGDPTASIDLALLGYFDQLAVLPEARRRPALELALTALSDLFSRCTHVVTTTVAAPVTNLAAVPLIERLGGERVGRLDEEYPELGALTSHVWLMSRKLVYERVQGGSARVERWARALRARNVNRQWAEP